MVQGGDAAAGKACEIGGTKAFSSGQQQVSRSAFLILGANPGAIRRFFRQLEAGAVNGDQFLGQHPAGTVRQWSAGEDADCLARLPGFR